MAITLNSVILNELKDKEFALIFLKETSQEPVSGLMAKTLGQVLEVHPSEASVLIPAYAQYLRTFELELLLKKYPQPCQDTIMLLVG